MDIIKTNRIESLFMFEEFRNLKQDEFIMFDINGIILEVTKNDTQEILFAEMEKRKKFTAISDDERTPRDLTIRGNLIEKFKKSKDIDDTLKLIKTATKYSQDNAFPRRELYKILEDKGYIKAVPLKDINTESLKHFLVGQTMLSLYEYGVIHPKIKIFIGEVEKEEKSVQED